MEGIELLADAILKLTDGTPSRLTNLHAPLLALCLKAQSYTAAEPFLELDPAKLFNETFEPVTNAGTIADVTVAPAEKKRGAAGSFFSTFSKVVTTSVPAPPSRMIEPAEGLLDDRSVLLYFYYGGMILAATERYEQALRFFELAISLPANRPSAIVVESRVQCKCGKTKCF